MASVANLPIGSFKIALSIGVFAAPTPTINVTPTVLQTSGITKVEMEQVVADSDSNTLTRLDEISGTLESIKLGIQIGTEEELDMTEEIA